MTADPVAVDVKQPPPGPGAPGPVPADLFAPAGRQSPARVLQRLAADISGQQARETVLRGEPRLPHPEAGCQAAFAGRRGIVLSPAQVKRNTASADTAAVAIQTVIADAR